MQPKPDRHVFYFHGFDRRRARFYYLWQKREARIYSRRHGRALEVSQIDGKSWMIEGEIRTRFHFMDWTDLVQEEFSRSLGREILRTLRLLLAGIGEGFFGKIRRRDWGMGLVLLWGFFPFGLWLVLMSLGLVFWPHWIVAIAVPGVAALWLLRRFDEHFGIFYITRIASFARRMALGNDAVLENRIAQFRAQIDSVEGDILIVGHSIGAALAVQVLETAKVDAELVTVGQSIPLVSCQKAATNLRRALENMDRWIDVSAGRDVLGFQDFDPSSGRAKCVSAHFGRSFSADTLKASRWNGFLTHFRYFESVEKLGAPWDWFEILTGAEKPSVRFKHDVSGSGKGGRRCRY